MNRRFPSRIVGPPGVGPTFYEVPVVNLRDVGSDAF
jgi:hypothetical protein